MLRRKTARVEEFDMTLDGKKIKAYANTNHAYIKNPNGSGYLMFDRKKDGPIYRVGYNDRPLTDAELRTGGALLGGLGALGLAGAGYLAYKAYNQPEEEQKKRASLEPMVKNGVSLEEKYRNHANPHIRAIYNNPARVRHWREKKVEQEAARQKSFQDMRSLPQQALDRAHAASEAEAARQAPIWKKKQEDMEAGWKRRDESMRLRHDAEDARDKARYARHDEANKRYAEEQRAQLAREQSQRRRAEQASFSDQNARDKSQVRRLDERAARQNQAHADAADANARAKRHNTGLALGAGALGLGLAGAGYLAYKAYNRPEEEQKKRASLEPLFKEAGFADAFMPKGHRYRYESDPKLTLTEELGVERGSLGGMAGGGLIGGLSSNSFDGALVGGAIGAQHMRQLGTEEIYARKGVGGGRPGMAMRGMRDAGGTFGLAGGMLAGIPLGPVGMIGGGLAGLNVGTALGAPLGEYIGGTPHLDAKGQYALLDQKGNPISQRKKKKR